MRQGEATETKLVGTFMLPTDTLVGGWCDVHTKDGTIPTTVLLDDFDTGKSLWLKMPGTMIEKCAIVKALRMAFPEKLAGAYAAEEMEQARVFDDVNLTEDINRASVQAVPLQEIEPTGQIIEQQVISAPTSKEDAEFWCDEHGVAMTQNEKQKQYGLASHKISNTGDPKKDNCNGDTGNRNKPAARSAPAVKKVTSFSQLKRQVNEFRTEKGLSIEKLEYAIGAPIEEYFKEGNTFDDMVTAVEANNEQD